MQAPTNCKDLLITKVSAAKLYAITREGVSPSNILFKVEKKSNLVLSVHKILKARPSESRVSPVLRILKISYSGIFTCLVQVPDKASQNTRCKNRNEKEDNTFLAAF